LDLRNSRNLLALVFAVEQPYRNGRTRILIVPGAIFGNTSARGFYTDMSATSGCGLPIPCPCFATTPCGAIDFRDFAPQRLDGGIVYERHSGAI